jgi:hypothetical protein
MTLPAFRLDGKVALVTGGSKLVLTWWWPAGSLRRARW